ncbi:spore germination protein [Paenibacillus hamazuiensis]|uniref:spore germination protein n=1 Tax=Paenibacillus hamazuiensis TaxID=2936508 RepID=UPI00200F113D|nr:spore germination protein [Paenibacillus hamazuiensis]
MTSQIPQLQTWLRQKLSDSTDFVQQELKYDGQTAAIYYLKSVTDVATLQKLYIVPFFTQFQNLQDYVQYVRSLSHMPNIPAPEALLQSVLRGTAVVFVSGEAIPINVQHNISTQLSEATVENTVQGPKHAFSEDADININLVRMRYAEASLTTEKTSVGKLSHTPVTLVYDKQLVNPQVLEELKKRLACIDSDVLQAASQLQVLLNKKRRSIVPTMMVTERPDRVVFNLARGKIALIVHGSPFVLILPAVFYDFMAGIDNFYQHYWVTQFLVVLRYIGLLSSLTLAAFYVGLTSYNPEILRVQLALSIAGSRAPVPYPSYFEVLFMLLMMELLTEASVRLPKTIGSTATTVGGLILGQAATQAGLVSNIMIIVVAAVAISNFVIPITELGFGIRLFRYIILMMTTIFGLVGLVLSFIAIVTFIADQDSFGQPYLKIFWKNSGRRA